MLDLILCYHRDPNNQAIFNTPIHERKELRRFLSKEVDTYTEGKKEGGGTSLNSNEF